MVDKMNRSNATAQQSLQDTQSSKIGVNNTSHGAEQKTQGSAIKFTDEQIAQKRTWYAGKNYDTDFIKAVQRTVGVDDDGKVGKNTITKIAEWQKSHNMKPDGLFGTSSAAKAKLQIKYAPAKASTQDTAAGQAPAHGKGSGAARTHKLGSGTPSWCTSQGFANNTSLDALSEQHNFKAKAKAVISAIRAAGAGVTITAVLRHPARAAMMAYARHFRDNKSKVDRAREILKGQYNVTVSGNAADARAANAAFGVGGNPVGLNSNHIWGLAVDMSITGLSKGSSIVVDGKKMTILGGGSPQARLNATLKANNFSHFMWFGPKDKPHWSHNGR